MRGRGNRVGSSIFHKLWLCITLSVTCFPASGELNLIGH